MFCILGNNLITGGETSDEFYVYTSPTLQPADLQCDTTYDTISLTWRHPTLGMDFIENSTTPTFQFSYTLTESMLIEYSVFHKSTHP